MGRDISFRFKRFGIEDARSGMKIGTDGVLLGAWADCAGVRNILDIGAGCGLISLMLAQRSEAHITAVEIDADAAEDAEENIERSAWRDRIDVHIGNFRDYVPIIQPDLIISNPPFFSTGEISPDAVRAAARHERSLSFINLISYAAAHLSPSGSLAMISPYDRKDEILFQLELSRLKLHRLCRVISREGKPPARILWECTRSGGDTLIDDLTIRNRSNEYTDRYKDLTKDFYLNF